MQTKRAIPRGAIGLLILALALAPATPVAVRA
jgi:hypothetical protein